MQIIYVIIYKLKKGSYFCKDKSILSLEMITAELEVKLDLGNVNVATLKNSEAKALLFLIKKAYEYNMRKYPLAKKEFAEGTGLSVATRIEAQKGLEEKGLVDFGTTAFNYLIDIKF